MKTLLPILLLFLWVSCEKDELVYETSLPASNYSHKIPMLWNQMYLEIERYCPGYKPPVSARNNAYINLIVYEAIVEGSGSKYKSLSSYYPNIDIDRPKPSLEYNWEVVANAAYSRAFEMFFPTAPAEQQFQMLAIGHQLDAELRQDTDPDVYARSKAHGEAVANVIYQWSIEDEMGHEAYLSNIDPSYVPPQREGLWKPTYPDYQPALLPNWGKVRTFAARGSDGILPPPPFRTDTSSVLYKEARFTYNMVNEIKLGQHQEDYWIAEFWSDDCPILTFSPAGRWVSITNQLISIERLDLLETVVAYTKVGMALADAGIKCWENKYRYNCLRPIDYIHEYMGDREWNTIMCPDGSGGFYTPNFPTYPSGHATFSAAAAVVLEDIFGKNYSFTDRSHEGRTEFKSTPRSFSSIWDMAIENAYSRVPLGVHFMSDSEAGTDLGYKVGHRVIQLPWQ
ncbi:vanadium-dependent haloperoxidase [Membranihabitans marinus]|uniref:vanadium-dependent haloperoxidase n=1 Tax=Membranihabitans marinus TaxID=1227546 RepID=UPI001F27169C|nr:vanadium-dependent haloperoxidase [Membranihabitans marinus]